VNAVGGDFDKIGTGALGFRLPSAGTKIKLSDLASGPAGAEKDDKAG
jgi:hypothetical protein